MKLLPILCLVPFSLMAMEDTKYEEVTVFGGQLQQQLKGMHEIIATDRPINDAQELEVVVHPAANSVSIHIQTDKESEISHWFRYTIKENHWPVYITYVSTLFAGMGIGGFFTYYFI